MNFSLESLGYDDFFAAQMAKLDSNLAPARVVGQHRRQWDVANEQGSFRASLAGRLWARENVTQVDDAQPTVGDWVALESGDETTAPTIVHVLERRTELSRTSMARRGLRQTVVANIDFVAVVAAFSTGGAKDHAALRSLHPRRIERYVTAVRQGGAEPIVLLNKSDLDAEPKEKAAALSARLGSCQVLPVSTHLEHGLDAFFAFLRAGQTIGLVGLSGVGKSSIVNHLLGSDIQQIGEERKADTRGRHTTTHRQLFVAPSGVLLIDTPGMREFALSESLEGDRSAFEDIAALAARCQFRDCSHGTEPGCVVRQATLDGSLDADRLKNFRALAGEQKTSPVKQRRHLTRKRLKYPGRKQSVHGDDDVS